MLLEKEEFKTPQVRRRGHLTVEERKQLNYLKRKEKVTPLDKAERYELMELEHKAGLYEARETKKCVICGDDIQGYGNNADPIADGICCDKCNASKVIPARLSKINKNEKLVEAELNGPPEAMYGVLDCYGEDWFAFYDNEEEAIQRGIRYLKSDENELGNNVFGVSIIGYHPLKAERIWDTEWYDEKGNRIEYEDIYEDPDSWRLTYKNGSQSTNENLTEGKNLDDIVYDALSRIKLRGDDNKPRHPEVYANPKGNGYRLEIEDDESGIDQVASIAKKYKLNYNIRHMRNYTEITVDLPERKFDSLEEDGIKYKNRLNNKFKEKINLTLNNLKSVLQPITDQITAIYDNVKIPKPGFDYIRYFLDNEEKFIELDYVFPSYLSEKEILNKLSKVLKNIKFKYRLKSWYQTYKRRLFDRLHPTLTFYIPVSDLIDNNIQESSEIEESYTDPVLYNVSIEAAQAMVDTAIEKFGRVGAGLMDDLDELGFYVVEEDGKYIVHEKFDDLEESFEDKEQTFTFDVHYKNGKIEKKTIKATNYHNAVKEIMKDKKVDSIDDLKESFEDEHLGTSTESTPEPGPEAGIASLINKLIVDEWEAIQGYNDAIVAAETEGYSDIAQVLRDIANEENLHVGQLEQCMKTISPNAESINQGEVEADGQLNTTTETSEDPEEGMHY